MPFNEAEISNQDSNAITLYLFTWGEARWAYSSSDHEREYGDDLYMPIAIGDNGVVQGGDSANTDFLVKMPASAPLVALFAGSGPSDPVWLTVRRAQLNESDAPVCWVGSVASCKRVDEVAVEVSCQAASATLTSMGLRLCWERNCPHVLYDVLCRADKVSKAVPAIVTDVSGNILTVDSTGGKPSGWFDGGFFEWDDAEYGSLDRRGIQNEVDPLGLGLSFYILGSLERLQVGQAVVLYPGCDRTPEVCEDKFDNKANYGGYEFMPGKSPFDGTPVF